MTNTDRKCSVLEAMLVVSAFAGMMLFIVWLTRDQRNINQKQSLYEQSLITGNGCLIDGIETKSVETNWSNAIIYLMKEDHTIELAGGRDCKVGRLLTNRVVYFLSPYNNKAFTTGIVDRAFSQYLFVEERIKK